MFKKKYVIRYFLPLIIILALVYSVITYSDVKVKQGFNQFTTDIVINFFLPMNQDDSFIPQITISSEIPSTPIFYKAKWLDSNTMILKLEQRGYPLGQLLTIQIDDVPTIIPFIKKSVRRKVRPQVPITLLSKSHLEKIPSRGPVPIIFNTPVDQESLKKLIKLPIPGQLKPIEFKVDGESYTDFSCWKYIPDDNFDNNSKYQITFNPGIRSMGGSVINERREITFTIANRPKIISTNPGKNANHVQLYRTIEFALDQDISTANVQITDLKGKLQVAGDTEIKENKVVFRPDNAFLPGKRYKAELQAESKDHEPMNEYQFAFTTLNMGDRYWVEVKLGKTHTVTIYKGDKEVRHMLASGGRSECPTPLGYFYTQDRGPSFWSPRFGEGATYWVRLVGQYLVHSVPRDSRWKVKEEEQEKLGGPASHGCVRLDEEDAKWFYENIPGGTLVIIHP